MANGFFLGGVAEGLSENERQRVAREELALRSRGLDITERGQTADIGFKERSTKVSERAQSLAEKNAAREADKDMLTRVDRQLADTMSIIGETIKTGVAAGKDPAMIQKAIAPLVDGAKRIAPYAKQSPEMIDAKVGALFSSPTLVETATAAGTAEGTKKVAERTAIAASGLDPNALDDPKKKIDAENALRDDFLKQSEKFITVRDYYRNFENAEKTGPGDVTRIYSFIKMLDPGSAVMQGELATAQNAGGVPEGLRALYNKLITGEGTLSDTLRGQYAAQAKKLFESRGVEHDRLQTQFRNIAKRQGLTVGNVVVELGDGPVPSLTGTTATGIRYTVTPTKK